MAEERQAAGNVDHVGILTGGKRNVWATARQRLAEGVERELLFSYLLATDFHASF